jgi:hypothetical protein
MAGVDMLFGKEVHTHNVGRVKFWAIQRRTKKRSTPL